MHLNLWSLTVSLSLLLTAAAQTLPLLHAQLGEPPKSRVASRIFWQDSADQSIAWGDLQQIDGAWQLKPADVNGWPKLDVDQQSHVQMQFSDGIILTGVHDADGGKFQSGWVAIETGVTQEAHGDHFHWQYGGQPTVIAQRLDAEQGNPAHVYLYDGGFYLANDKKNGITQVKPAELRSNGGKSAGQFISAGGGHITLAVAKQAVAYATWMDRDGDNAGRVDVVGLGSNAGRNYKLQLPSGGLHGATANSGKVFFAPADGICWLTADLAISQKPEAVKIEALSLGEDAEGKPKRTGAFTNSGKHLLCTTGRGTTAELCIVDASSPKPTVIKLALPGAEGTSVTSPECVQTRTGESFALLFEESSSGEQSEKLHVVALDPNRDGSYADATCRVSLDVGRSQIEGHSGHHAVAPIGKRFVAITNPGDGTICLISTSDWSVQATFKVDGTPTRLLAVGG